MGRGSLVALGVPVLVVIIGEAPPARGLGEHGEHHRAHDQQQEEDAQGDPDCRDKHGLSITNYPTPADYSLYMPNSLAVGLSES